MSQHQRSISLASLLLMGVVVSAPGAAAQSPPTPPGARESTPVRSGATLLVPARPDSAPPESEPGPLLIPGRRSLPDSSVRTPAQRARDAYALGRRLEVAGVPGTAIVAYRNAVGFDPTIPDANFRMGMLFLGRDQFAEAAKCLTAELVHHPDNDEASRQLGLCLVRGGDTARALEHLGRLARLRPRDGANWHALGSAYLAAGRPREAETALRRALRLEPTTVDELRDLGAAMAALGRDAEARSQYQQALRLQPSDAASWLDLGNLERRGGRPDSALVRYRRAEAADSGLVPALQAQIQLLSEAKRDGEVADTYRRWLNHHPEHHGARFEAIRLLDSIGREDEALAVAEEGTRRLPDSGQPYVLLAMVLRGRGDTRGALVALRRAETLSRDAPGERERVRRTITALRASAPDSLRAVFAADSVAAAAPRRR